jgi:hypothetical protein
MAIFHEFLGPGKKAEKVQTRWKEQIAAPPTNSFEEAS